MSDVVVPPIPFRRATLGALAFGSFLSLFLVWSLLHPRIEGDTIALVQGADAARTCLAHGQFRGCSGISYFALFQYLPAAGLGAIGAPDATIVRVLAAISTVSFAAILLLAWRIVSRRAGSGAAAVVIASLASGLLLWYARSSFGEMLAALLTLLFVEAMISRRSTTVVTGTLWLAGITKESALPLLLAMAAVALFGFGGRVRLAAVRPQLVGLGAGSVLVLVTTGGFNFFRYGTVVNQYYFESIRVVPGLSRRVDQAVGLWAAPNGGVLFFWPLVVVVGASALLWGLRRRGEGEPPRWPAAALIGVVAFLTGGLASYFGAYGWDCWGPRLMLPWLPALVVLATVLYARPARLLAAWIGASVMRRVGVGVVVALVALPHLGALRGPDPLPRLFATDQTCPVQLIIEQVPLDYFYRCEHHRAWEKRPIWLDAVDNLGGDAGIALTLLVVLSCVSSLLLAQLGSHAAEAGAELRRLSAPAKSAR